jgi:UDP-glucuronate 4-epimerase
MVKSKTHQSYSFIQLKLEDKQQLTSLFEAQKFDVVVNLAAQAGVRYSLTNPEAYINSNIVGFTNIIENARHSKIKHLVYASSSSVYGLNESVPFSTSQNVDHPMSLYAASKKSNELMAHVYSHLYNIPTTGLRFFTVYGPWGRPDMALFLFTKAILEKKPIEVFNHGKMVRDFTYVDDIVEGIKRVVDSPPAGDVNWDAKSPEPSLSTAPYKIYNIGNNSPVTLLNFIQAIEEELGIKAIKNLKPLQPGDVPATYADVSDLVRDLNYKPNTSVKKGIENFINWYKAYYKVS